MADLAARAVAAAMEVECKKDALKQLQSGDWKLSLTIALDGLPEAMMKAAPGVRYRAFFVEVSDNEEPIQHAPPETKPKRHWDELSYAEQAGIRCQDVQFTKFLADYYHWDTRIKDSAAQFVRSHCQVASRAELDTFPGAAMNWKALDAEFQEWDNRVAEKR